MSEITADEHVNCRESCRSKHNHAFMHRFITLRRQLSVACKVQTKDACTHCYDQEHGVSSALQLYSIYAMSSPPEPPVS